jgi:hypothetical protein
MTMESQMKKTLILAVTILTLGVGSAFAADGDANGWAAPAQVSKSQSAAQANGGNLVFAVSGHPQTNVYGMFRGPGYTQGGEQ